MVRVMAVLKSGGEYTVEHVERFAGFLNEFLPDTPLFVLSDVACGDVHIPLNYDWPGWFSKMELFRPELKGDILYFDLDTVITGDLSDLLKVDQLTLLRDFYRDGIRKPEGLQSSVMYLPEMCRREIWNAWIKQPWDFINKLKPRGLGDQAFLEAHWLKKAARWQDLLPGQLVSFKVHCKGGLVPEGTRAVIYHGQPRPWSIKGALNG